VPAVLLNRISMLLAFAGVFVAGVLTISHILQVQVPCGPEGGCAVVTQHPKSMWFGIPVAYLGVAAYSVLAFLSARRSMTGLKSQSLANLGALISGIGFVVSWYLQYVALFEIRATCLWCLASAIIMTLLFVTQLLLLKAAAPADESFVDTDYKLMLGLGLAVTFGMLGYGMTRPPSGQRDVMRLDALQDLSDQELVPEDAHIYGSPTAPITVIEFGDLVCETCKRNNAPMHEIVDSSRGQVRLVFRQLPIVQNPEHRLALPAAIIAEMAGERGNFWKFVNGMYSFQEMPSREEIYALAKACGVSEEDIDKHLGDPDSPYLLKVKRDMDVAAKLLRQPATPSYIILKKDEPRIAPKDIVHLRSILVDMVGERK
jgi:uncharacterized membrane protein/protein-disulfide isomerase